MAKKEDVQNQKELNQELRNEISLEEQILSLLADRRGIDSDILSDQQNLNNVLIDQVKNMNFEVVQRKQIRDLSASVTKIANEAYSIGKDQLGLTETNVSIAKQQEALTKNIFLLEQQRKQLITSINDGTATDAELNKNIADSIAMQVKEAKNLKNQLAEVAKNSEEISDNFGVASFGGLSEVLDKLGMGKIGKQLGVEQAAESARGMAQNIQEAANSGGKGLTKERIKQLGLEKKLGNLSGAAAANKVKGMSGMTKAVMALKAGMKTMFTFAKKALGPIGLIVEAVQAIIRVDKASGEVAKNLGTSAAQARIINAEMADAADMSGDMLVTTQKVVAANLELNKIFGTAVVMSGKLAAEFAAVKERTGLSGHAMEIFAEKALLSGTTITEQLEKVRGVTMELSAQTGIMLNAKDIQEGIGQMSKTQLLNNQMNTKEIANQVFQAKLLGLSQSQLESTQNSLLDFESSIAAEMEAELLTGKQLNLEGARAAALAGDQAKLAAELRKEVGTAAEFGKMNVIQQEAMAKAFGMSREDMAGMLIEQEKLEAIKAQGFKSASDAQNQYNEALKNGTMTEELKNDLIKAGVYEQMESATQADKMAAAMEKLSDVFVQLMDPLMPIIDALMSVLKPIFAILSPIAKLIGDIVGLVMDILNPALEAIMTNMDALGNIFTSIFNLDFGGLMTGFKQLGAGIVNTLLSPVNGVIRLMNKIPGVDIDELGFDNAEIAGLATGGIVTKPTMAMIGEGGESEAVIPLSKLENMLPSRDLGNSLLKGLTAPMRAIGSLIPSEGIQSSISSFEEDPISSIGGIFESAKDGITNIFRGEDKNSDNGEVVVLLKELITAVKQGGDVYIDGAKAGRSMALATSKMG